MKIVFSFGILSKKVKLNFFDVNFEEIKDYEYLTTIFDEADYIYFETEELVHKLNKELENFGYPVIGGNCKKGLYKFDSFYDNWMNLTEMQEQIEELISKIPH